ncbi:MBL fold metallo-hydrolase [Desulfobacca acetoxidans]|uniref:Beta-lactamase domain protein n=1 Tax=Desulfobacca acetoxidans (strain ATCC 700848 / DSM 11109 / ASRB2) TaxID=880072 RepID=F2NHC6_DESAR|nr:MBL fold metallo-hydrolase [Desulfobacca acetoxidans]AEB09042.1 beta-lactamase domain protein [Desulfobacca acetoxidans DSM 11109]
MTPHIAAVQVGPLAVLCYIINCPSTRQGLLIDPAAPSAAVTDVINRRGLTIRWIVNTHGHPDHTAGNDYWAQQTGATTVIHELDWHFFSTPEMQQAAITEGFPPLSHIDLLVQDGYRLPLGELELSIIHTPGHTPGSICLYTPGHLFTGDTLFVDSAGRTDLPGGSLGQLVDSIQRRILPLPDDTIIWPGHDYGDTPTSTLGEQKLNNPYITDFLD